MEPFLKYPGGKTKEIPLVNKYKPKQIKRYFEPFVGGGAIYLKFAIKNSYINDKSKNLIDLYIAIKKQDEVLKATLEEIDYLWHSIEMNIAIPKSTYFLIDQVKFNDYYKKALVRKQRTLAKYESYGLSISDDDKKNIELTARKTALYMNIRDIYNSSKISVNIKTASFYFLREYCYSSMFRFSKNGDFNVPYGGRSYDKKYLKAKIDKMFNENIQKLMSTTEVYNEDFEEFFNRFDFKNNDFIFVDPPYDTDFSSYDNNSFDKNEQLRLCQNLSKIKAKWMLIIKKTEFIVELYKNFYVYEYDMKYMVSFKNRNDRKVEHLLITNYKIEGGTSNELVVEN